MKKEIISQYKAAFKMLLDAVNKCPDNLWDNNEYGDAYWRIVYHTLFSTSVYLSPSITKFKPWAKHKKNYNSLGTIARDNTPIIIENSYSKDELTEYLESIVNICEKSLKGMLPDEESGFEWLPMNKIELHLYNIRHIQHHIGQLVDRLHQSGIKGINWERMG
jgi:hypothetical protein